MTHSTLVICSASFWQSCDSSAMYLAEQVAHGGPLVPDVASEMHRTWAKAPQQERAMKKAPSSMGCLQIEQFTFPRTSLVPRDESTSEESWCPVTFRNDDTIS
jgi:hypothetical protein